MVLQVYNNALRSNVFPPSWQVLCIKLAKKKGNLTSLKNWRPISLINCDAKIYTRILNTRLLKVISTLITRFQTGFMPNCFIDENGLVLSVVIEHARRCKRPGIALLLDQGKTYDRVHPSYLKSVLLKFRSSSTLVNSIIGLFFGNRVCININRHFTEEVDQCRGHRQGDLLSPLLFNLALEPFLRHVLRGTSLVCFSFPDLSSTLSPPVALKELAYADDVCVFLSSQADFIRAQHHLDTYGLVSNAKINLSKTEVIFLNGGNFCHNLKSPSGMIIP